MAPIRISLAGMAAYTQGTSYVWRVPLIKNPSSPYISLRYNLTLVNYPNGAGYGVIVNQHECTN